jgi:hypothetical protein
MNNDNGFGNSDDSDFDNSNNSDFDNSDNSDFDNDFDKDFENHFDNDFDFEFAENWDELSQEIPKELYSAYSEKPFNECLACGKDLIASKSPYEIQKVYKNKEVIFEYAICMECGEDLMKEYSKESLQALQEFFVKNYRPSSSMDTCHTCEESKGEEYSVLAMCHGNQLITLFVLCNSCMERTEECISEKTRRAMGDFIEQKFPGIPAEFGPYL